MRIALANLRDPGSPTESVELALQAIADAAAAGARIVCFPECYVPGYPWPGMPDRRVDRAFLEESSAVVASAAGRARIAVVLGTERVVDGAFRLTALVVDPDGKIAGFQDKVQLDPSEDALYAPGSGRRVFTVDDLKYGVVICHEGFRYPETTRACVRQGAQLVFHPHYDRAEPGRYAPKTFADPANSFHEKAILCRAAENTCYVASVNCASAGSPTTSAIARPDGTLLAYQPYGKEGLLVAEIDPARATGLYARRLREGG
jgi:predicted amidohydrolase